MNNQIILTCPVNNVRLHLSQLYYLTCACELSLIIDKSLGKYSDAAVPSLLLRHFRPIPPMIHRSVVVNQQHPPPTPPHAVDDESSVIEEEAAAVRTGRSGGGGNSAIIDHNQLGNMMRFLQLQQLDRLYDAKRIRPR